VTRARWTLGMAIAASLGLALATAPSAVLAKPAKRRATTHKPAPVHPRQRSAATAAARSPDKGPSEPDAEGSAAAEERPADDHGQDDAKVQAAGGKVKTKTYTFGAMDVEGKLKTPQLLYFLNRVKLELDMSAPDKRSFMKELGQSADDRSL
jgi:hypothetical protein